MMEKVFILITLIAIIQAQPQFSPINIIPTVPPNIQTVNIPRTDQIPVAPPGQPSGQPLYLVKTVKSTFDPIISYIGY